jgi:hypothetical protein
VVLTGEVLILKNGETTALPRRHEFLLGGKDFARFFGHRASCPRLP